MVIPSSVAREKRQLTSLFRSYQKQTTVADSQPLVAVAPVGPIEIKSPAASIAELVQVVVAAQRDGGTSLVEDQVLSLP